MNEYTNRLKNTINQLLSDSSEQVIDISCGLYELKKILQKSTAKVKSVYVQTQTESDFTKIVSGNADTSSTEPCLQENCYNLDAAQEEKEGNLAIKINEQNVLQREVMELRTKLLEKEKEYNLVIEKLADLENFPENTNQDVLKLKYRKKEKNSRNQQMKLEKLQDRFNSAKERVARLEVSVANNEELENKLQILKVEVIKNRQSSEVDIQFKQTIQDLEHVVTDKKVVESVVQSLTQKLKEKEELTCISELTKMVADKDAYIETLISKVSQLKQCNSELCTKTEHLSNELDKYQQLSEKKKSIIEDLEVKLSERNLNDEKRDACMKQKIIELEEAIREKNVQLVNLSKKIVEVEPGINDEVKNFKQKNDEQLAHICELTKTIEDKNPTLKWFCQSWHSLSSAIPTWSTKLNNLNRK